MRFTCCAITILLFVVFLGCFELNNVTKDTVDDVADCYEGTIAVDDHYAIVLNKDCMDTVLLPAPAVSAEAECPETEAAQQYPCPIEDRGDWTLLATLKAE